MGGMGGMAVRLGAGEERHGARAVMAIFAVARAQSEFDFQWVPGLARQFPGRDQGLAISWMNGRQPAPGGQLRRGNAGDLGPPFPTSIVDPVRARRPYQLRRGLDQRAVARFAIAERLLGFVPVMDVNADADPFKYGAALVTQRDRATQMPAIFTVPAPVT